MDPVSNTERLLRLLRGRLEGRAKATRPAAASQAPSMQRASGMEGVRQITERMLRSGADLHALRQACVEQLLLDSFGVAFANDARFQDISQRVLTMLEGDAELSGALDAVITELRDIS